MNRPGMTLRHVAGDVRVLVRVATTGPDFVVGGATRTSRSPGTAAGGSRSCRENTSEFVLCGAT
jgi:hypothetical protein